MSEGKSTNFLLLSELINSNIDEHELLVKKLYLNPDLINFEAFKTRLEKEINDIDCTPSRDGATIEEIQDFFKEVDNVPLKLQRHKKVKEIQKLNTTVHQRRALVKEFAGSSCNLTQIAPNLTFGVDSTNSVVNFDRNLTPKKILNSFNDCKLDLEKVVQNFNNNVKTLQNCNGEIEKIKKFISELEAASKNCNDQSKIDTFAKEEDILHDFVKSVEQLAYINENQNFYLESEGAKRVNNLKVLMDTVNDLLKNII